MFVNKFFVNEINSRTNVQKTEIKNNPLLRSSRYECILFFHSLDLYVTHKFVSKLSYILNSLIVMYSFIGIRC